LLVDADAERARSVKRGLEATGCTVVAVAPDAAALSERARQTGAEIIVCELDDPSRDTLESMQALHRDAPMPVVLFAAKAGPDQVQSALEAGVAAYVMEGLEPGRLRPVLDVAIRQFRAHESLRAELASARQTLAERDMVDRAKQRLMRERGLSEPEAHRRLRRMAMDRGMKLANIAASILHE